MPRSRRPALKMFMPGSFPHPDEKAADLKKTSTLSPRARVRLSCPIPGFVQLPKGFQSDLNNSKIHTARSTIAKWRGGAGSTLPARRERRLT